MPGFLGTSVLIIEDNKSDTDFIQHVLFNEQPSGEALKYRLAAMASLEEVLGNIQYGVEVILLDLDLPDSRGLSTFQAVAEKTGDIPIIILTGQDDFGTSVEATRLGAHRWLYKQWIIDTPQMLHYTVSDAAELFRQSQQLNLLGRARLGELKSIIMQCSVCEHLKREDTGVYVDLAEYLETYDIHLSHGICDRCGKEKYGQYIE